MTFGARAISILLLLPLASTAESQSEPLGRLFFTPGQRAQLDRLRQSGLSGNALGNDESLTINGQIIRHDGKRMTWINGRPITDFELPTAATNTRDLKVGETLHQDSGERKDLLKGGRLTVTRPAAP